MTYEFLSIWSKRQFGNEILDVNRFEIYHIRQIEVNE